MRRIHLIHHLMLTLLVLGGPNFKRNFFPSINSPRFIRISSFNNSRIFGICCLEGLDKKPYRTFVITYNKEFISEFWQETKAATKARTSRPKLHKMHKSFQN